MTGSPRAARRSRPASRPAASAVVEALVFVLAFPQGSLTGLGVAVVGLLQLVAFSIWGGSVVADRKHVRAANQAVPSTPR